MRLISGGSPIDIDSNAQRALARGGAVDDLAQEISARIMAGDLVAGTWLRQEWLAREFGVSRTPVREAMRKLQASGIVDVVPNRGTIVRGPSERDIREAYLVRAELEGLAAELAAQHILDSQLARLRDAKELFRRSVEAWVSEATPAAAGENAALRAWVEANDLFHTVVHEAADNERLRRSILDIHNSFPRQLTWASLSEDSRLLAENVEEHERIYEAIATRDGNAARVAMRCHVSRAGDLVASRFTRFRRLADADSISGRR